MAEQSEIISIKVNLDGAERGLKTLGEIKATIEALKKQRLELSPGTQEFAKASQQINTLTGLYRGLQKDAGSAADQISRANDELNEPQPKAIGHYRQLQAELIKLKNEFKNLSAEEIKGARGADLANKVKSISTELKGFDASLGDYQRNVGNYRSALLQIGDVFTGGLATGGVTAAIGVVTASLAAAASEALKLESSIDDLQALTGVSDEAIQGFKDAARELESISLNGVEITNTSSDIVEAFKLIGGARPELLENAEALKEVAKQAIILQKASGLDLQSAVDATTTVLGQFQLQSEDTAAVVNELARGAQLGAAEIPQITEALKNAGTAANLYGVKTSEAISLIELLADRQLKGAEAGTQLRNIFLKLSAADVLPKSAVEQLERLGVNIDLLKDKSVPLSERLKELAKIQGDSAAIAKVFGTENAQAATIITDGLPKYLELQKSIEGTNSAFEQAATKSDNTSQKLDNLATNGLNKLTHAFEYLQPVINLAIDYLSAFIDLIGIFGSAVADIGSNVVSFFSDQLSEAAAFLGFADNATAAANAQEDFNDRVRQGADNLEQFSDEARRAAAAQEDFEDRVRQGQDNEKAASDERIKRSKDEDSERKRRIRAEEDDNKRRKKAADDLAKQIPINSLRFFEAEAQKLKEEIQKTPLDATGKLLKLKENLEVAEERLKEAREKVEQLGKALNELDTIPTEPIELGVVIDKEKTFEQLNGDINELAGRLSAEAGVTIPVEDSIPTFDPDELDRQKRLDDEKKEQQRQLQQELTDTAIQAAEQTAATILEIQKENLAARFELENSALEAEYNARLQAAQGSATATAAVEKEFAAKRLALEKKQAEERRKIAIKESTIQFALALVKSGGNPFQIALATIQYGLALALINSQKFAKGGIVKGAGQNSPAQGKDSVHALLAPGERVLTKADQAKIEEKYGMGIWKSIGAKDPNSIFSGRGHIAPKSFIPSIPAVSRFTSGGVATTVVAEFSEGTIDMLAARIANRTAAETGANVRTAIVETNQAARREEEFRQKTK